MYTLYKFHFLQTCLHFCRTRLNSSEHAKCTQPILFIIAFFSLYVPPPPKKKTIALFILDFSLFSVPQNSNASIMRLNTMFSDQQAHGPTNGCKWMNGTQDTRVTPLLFTRSVMGFLMTTESKASVLSIVSPSLPWGIRTHTDHRVITPCRPY